MVSFDEAFDDLGGKFKAKLKDLRVRRETHKDLYETFSNTAILEAKFDIDVFERLHYPAFVAIERERGALYSIYEVLGITPMHYQMSGLTSDMPLQIREEFLSRVGESWGSEETWIDITAVQTEYALVVRGGRATFERRKLIPLIGSDAHLLSTKTVKELLCIDGGLEIGTMMGFEIPLTVNPDDLIKYHVGVFGFTGVGKSNLTANLLRKLMRRNRELGEELKVAILDVSGEYTVHLLDFLLENGTHFYTTERFEDMDGLVRSQVIPETLERRANVDLRPIFERMMEEGRLGLIELPEAEGRITLQDIYELLSSFVNEKKAGAIRALQLLNELRAKFFKVPPDTEIFSLSDRERRELLNTISRYHEGTRYALDTSLQELIDYISSGPKEAGAEGFKKATPKELAYRFLADDISLLIMYLPEPELARKIVSIFLEHLLNLKKMKGFKTKTITVIDEAQEFIPRDAKGTAVDSNRAVEALLRQGRKYRSFVWISTQRVAHLNTNALQQLHSYFVSTLPRMYDRMVIADAFSLDYGLMEKVTELSTGEWLFVSYKATKQKNVPAFIRSENNEDYLVEFLQRVNIGHRSCS